MKQARHPAQVQRAAIARACLCVWEHVDGRRATSCSREGGEQAVWNGTSPGVPRAV